MKANCPKVAPKTITKLCFFALIFLTFFSPSLVSASTSSYYDWGPYYNQPKVLGISFSSLENLPIPPLPQEANIPPGTGLLPGNPLYFFERFVENTQLTFTTNPVQKEELRLDFAQERLSEARTLAEQGKYQEAGDAISFYKDAMHTIAVNSSVLAKENTQGAQELVSNIENTASANTLLIQNLSLSSPLVASQVWNQAEKASQEVLDAAADVQGEPPIPQDLSVSIQKLKEQGLITPEESDKIYGLGTRAGVRSELDKFTASGQFPATELAKLDQAVATNYPETYKQTSTILQFAEIRMYETYPQPTEELQEQIKAWQDLPGDSPPPTEIRPYLYHTRAQELATKIDFTSFPSEQQTEVARFYPQAVAENSTFTSQLQQEPTPTPSPLPTPSSEGTSETTPTPSPLPTPPPPEVSPYLTEYNGPLPGDPTYLGKLLSEGVSTFFAFDPVRRVELKMQYADERLREANALSKDTKKANLYEQTLKKYQQTIDSVSNSIKTSSSIPEDRRLELAEKLESEAARHGVVFEKGLLPPATNDTTILSDMILTAQNATDIAADVQGRLPLPAILANRLQDMKAQGLILPEEVEQLTQAKTREEVRERIRKLTEIGAFPPADAKKLDEAQLLNAPGDYNQLTEVRKIEELQNLRSVQTDLAQTPTLKNNADVLSQREKSLTQSIDTSLIKPEDLTGREDLKGVFDKLAASGSARPINRGQFGAQPPSPTDAVLATCPVGATFKTNEGCVWADSGNKINDYDQYKCSSAGQYYSFAAKKCVPNQRGGGFGDDASPVCPAGYNWVWQSQSCQISDNEVTPLPTPGPGDSESCPQESSYQAPNGCVWDNNGKKVTDSTDYKCERNQYYSFSQFKCVLYPTDGFISPDDFVPSCKDPNAYWSWSDGKCTMPRPIEGGIKEINIPQPTFVPPGNPLYFVKQWGEGLQKTFAFTPQAREQVSLSQAKERLAEAAYALKKDDKAGVKAAITSYISMMQSIVADVPREGLSEGAKQEIAKRLSDGSVEQNLMLQKLSAWAKEEDDDLIQAAISMPVLGVDRASDVLGEPVIPDDVRAKIEALPAEMISEENKKKLLEADSRVAVRAELTNLSNVGGLGRDDVVFLNDDFDKVDSGAQIELEELSKLAEIADITNQKDDINQKVEKNEDIVTKLGEFQKNFEPGQEIPAEIRPYVRLTRIDEITQTIRPDIVRLEDFQNRKDVQLAVATLQEEFRPTSQSIQQVRDFKRRNPNAALPFDLARIEALSFSLGVRQEAGACYLPTPPFPANTPCPAPGASIPIASYYGGYSNGPANFTSPTPAVDKDGKPYTYGQGPQAQSAGVCPDGYHWMYDSGGWCMSNGGNYSPSYNYTPTGTGSGYTPYSPYYTAPGAPPATYGYPTGGNYSSSPYSYGAPSYYGPAPTNYTTNPPSGTVPGSGPAPISPGQCPSGFHWMSDSGGWCMSNGNTYVPSGTSGGIPYSPNLTQSSCGPGYYWDGQGCIRTSPTDTPSSYQYGCTPGYYWDNGKCVAGNYEGGNWSDTAARSRSYCQPPSGGCGYSSYWDYGSCSCRGASTYSGGSTTTPGSYSSGYNTSTGSCTQQTCRSSEWFDWGTCSCRPTGNTYTPVPGTTGTSGSSSGSCPSGSHWMSDNGGYCMSDGGGSSSSSTSGGSCPSGYHWMSDSGGWCMSDGGGGSTSTYTPPSSTSTPSSPAPSSEPAPTTAPSSEPAPTTAP